MMRSIFRPHLPPIHLLVMLGITAIVGTAAGGFASSSALPGQTAGDGKGTITAYAVTNVAYVLDTNDPRQIAQVTFTITVPAGSAAPTTVRARINTSAWTKSCVPPSGTTYTCTFSPQVTAASAIVAPAQLQVVATQ